MLEKRKPEKDGLLCGHCHVCSDYVVQEQRRFRVCLPAWLTGNVVLTALGFSVFHPRTANSAPASCGEIHPDTTWNHKAQSSRWRIFLFWGESLFSEAQTWDQPPELTVGSKPVIPTGQEELPVTPRL